MVQTTTKAISLVSESTSYPIYPTHGGAVVIGTQTAELFIQICVGAAGSLIVETNDGFVRYYPLLQPGVIYPITGRTILASATIDGNPVTTTASNIWWYGGK